MTVLISAKDVSLEFPAKKVLDGVRLGVNDGDRIGIVGQNGEGKSTLLAVLAGLVAPDSGEVVPTNNLKIGLLQQADQLVNTASVRSAIVGDAPEYTWAADRRIREILEALISDIPWEAAIAELSGGQRRRVDLASLLIQDWDVLLLDEPTNHLDLRGITWLAEHLCRRWPGKTGALLVVTHDRWFLDEVATTMWEVHDGTVEPFDGGFSAYIQQRVERERLARVRAERRQNSLRKELAWLARGARARSTKPKFHVQAALALINDDPPLRNTLELKRTALTRLGKQVLELEQATVRFDDHTVIDRLSWSVGPGDRIGILGENGAGKTTLLNLLSGQLPPSSGQVKTGATVKLAVLSQRLDELTALAGERVRSVLGRHKTRLVIDGKELTTSKLLERLGFASEHLQSYVGDLSGGQLRRLQLLLTLADEPNVLILDEPGNDLDTDMLAVLEDLLDSWPGTLLLVSHDRYLMERVTDDQFALMDGHLRHLPGGVEEFLRLTAKPNEGAGLTAGPASGANVAAGKAAVTGANPVRTPEQSSTPALSNAEIYQARKQLAALERKLQTLNSKQQQAAAALLAADPADYTQLLALQADLDQVKNELTQQEEDWLELSEILGFV